MATSSISSAAKNLINFSTRNVDSQKKSIFSKHLSFSNSSISLQKLSLFKGSHFSRKLQKTPISNVLETVESKSDLLSRTRDPGNLVKTERPTILVSEKLGEAGLDLLRTFGNVECSYNLSPDELCAKISLCDALIVRSGTKVTRQVFEAAKGRLKVVGRAGVGIDNVDLQAATEFGCLVVNAPTANTIAAAEHGIALLASMARNVAQADASMKDGMYIF
ncbi:D-3-phosphoglycerate dehydrogenase 2, chloroplastic-like [Olea europaea var. sylvestris]|uniref:D-3-phosphoglycerate dehydrogenase 2, chloroplastic-like n=1 Tax=Olea europaea var. sylvestris TaxID=158386 RepID=UPI000C1CDA42|nr:D-3-phosphoglycerate dehydrogenase 2, chloroplastic-like [Olea europaea var. sylvestris]